MKWRTEQELPKWAEVATVLILSPLWLLALAIGGFIYAAVLAKRWLIGPRVEWSSWFAWHPACLQCGQTAWLEIVERRSFYWLGDTHYRARPNTQTEQERP